MIRKTFLLFFIALFSLPGFCEEEPKFKVSPSGRVLIDGALYASPEKYLFKDGLSIPEARLGVKMYYGKWSSWIDVGFAYGKIGLRNMWIQYDFDNHNSLRAGNFLQPFGYQGPITTNAKSTFEQPIASALFTPGLQLGLMYTFNQKSFYSATAFHVESNALYTLMNYPQFNQQGYTIIERFVWRHTNFEQSGSPIFQAGLSLSFSSPERHLIGDTDVHHAFTTSANFPTRVSNTSALSVTVDNAKNRFKLSPELLLSYKRFALISQYFFQTIARRNNLPTYNAQGFYLTLRTLLIGEKSYSYEAKHATLNHPTKNTLEFVADYNFSDLNDSKAHLSGGRANSWSATFNYYFNPYITAKLNYTYTKVSGSPVLEPLYGAQQNVFQLRLMVLF